MVALGPPRFVTIHCTATPEGRDVKAEAISDMDRKRFNQVSYHYVIELDGNTVNTLPETVKGAHVGGANTGNIGVSYVGGITKDGTPKDTRTPEQRAALAKLIREYKARFPKIIVLGHRDWPNVAKACPCFSVSQWIKEGMN